MSAALTLGGKKLGKQWSACCPAHDDKSPSLIIFEGRTSAVQVRCMAGCEPIEIIAEIRWHEVADRLSMTPPPGERPLDGTATGRVTTKEPPLTGKKVPAVLACIAEWFPQAFVPEKYLPHRPLKIGIHIDLKARCPALSERERSAVLRYYVARRSTCAPVSPARPASILTAMYAAKSQPPRRSTPTPGSPQSWLHAHASKN